MIITLVALCATSTVCFLALLIFWDLAARKRQDVEQAASKRLPKLGALIVGVATIASAGVTVFKYFTNS